MAIVGLILIVVGIVLFFVQKNFKNKAFSIRSARAVKVTELEQMSQAIAQEIGEGSWRDYVKVAGTIECDHPLISELKQEPCVHYRMEVRREYEETVTRQDSEGKSHRETQRGSEVISSNKQSTPFFLNDQSGRIQINPEGADIEVIKILDEFRQEPARGGMLSFGGFSLALGNESFGGRRTLGYRYAESILPLRRRALIVGTVSDSATELTLQKPADNHQKFIISLKTEEELTKSTDQTAQITFYSMVACWTIGIILVILDLIF
jgi:hypothetical protein